jgi:hypothetical protein
MNRNIITEHDIKIKNKYLDILNFLTKFKYYRLLCKNILNEINIIFENTNIKILFSNANISNELLNIDLINKLIIFNLQLKNNILLMSYYYNNIIKIFNSIN